MGACGGGGKGEDGEIGGSRTLSEQPADPLQVQWPGREGESWLGEGLPPCFPLFKIEVRVMAFSIVDILPAFYSSPSPAQYSYCFKSIDFTDLAKNREKLIYTIPV